MVSFTLENILTYIFFSLLLYSVLLIVWKTIDKTIINNFIESLIDVVDAVDYLKAKRQNKKQKPKKISNIIENQQQKELKKQKTMKIISSNGKVIDKLIDSEPEVLQEEELEAIIETKNSKNNNKEKIIGINPEIKGKHTEKLAKDLYNKIKDMDPEKISNLSPRQLMTRINSRKGIDLHK